MSNVLSRYSVFKQFLDDVETYLESNPSEMVDQAPDGPELDVPQLLRRGVALGLFNRVEGLVQELAEDLCDEINAVRIHRQECSGTVWEDGQKLFAVALSRKSFDQGWDLTDHNSQIADYLSVSVSDHVVQLSHLAFYTGSNVNWAELTRALKFFRNAVSRGADDIPKVTDFFNALGRETHPAWLPSVSPIAPNSPSLFNEVWDKFARTRHAAAHEYKNAPTLDHLRQLVKYARICGEVLCLYHEVLTARLRENQIANVETSPLLKYTGDKIVCWDGTHITVTAQEYTHSHSVIAHFTDS